MTIRAVYENGVFRPTEPVELPEHSEVRVETDLLMPASPRKAMTAADLEKFRGKLKITEDPVAWQRRIRDEEWR